MKPKYRRILLAVSSAIILLYIILLIPDEEPPVSAFQSVPSNQTPFVWDQNEYWQYLEGRFVSARSTGREKLFPQFDSLYNRAMNLLHTIETSQLEPGAHEFRKLETLIFELAPIVAVCSDHYYDFAQLISQTRTAVKRRSEHWDMNSQDSRTTLYRLLYGGRMALEEIMLQMPPTFQIPNIMLGIDEPSQTPEGVILGIRIHSGDILLSRGTVPTSALIARGNDFPGNFSHAALVRVHPRTHTLSFIESHIERGVTVSTVEEYLNDVKFRVMVLRVRSDLPQIRAEPMLPHNAAQYALSRAEGGHIPYDFAMDFRDTTKWFCSEVVSEAYRNQGIHLWMGLSHLSSPGLQRWLAGFGARNFVTQEPSDLEYDPQLLVIAEWRNLETLRKDHYDNAVTEAMLDGANAGEPLRYSYFLLPFARVLKGYSVLLNMIGCVGPVPEGMPAVSALRHRWYTQRHNEITKSLSEEAVRFQLEKGYPPPYWQLVTIAESIKTHTE